MSAADEMARLGRWVMTGARPPYPPGDVPECLGEVIKRLHAELERLHQGGALNDYWEGAEDEMRRHFREGGCKHAIAAATTDGIATGLSCALVALEERIEKRVKADGRVCNCERCDETMTCASIVRSLLEATVEGKGP